MNAGMSWQHALEIYAGIVLVACLMIICRPERRKCNRKLSPRQWAHRRAKLKCQ